MLTAQSQLTLMTVWMILGTLAAAPPKAEFQVFQSSGPAQLKIQNFNVDAPNNWGTAYPLRMSVLGLDRGSDFLPLLAIALETSSNGEDRWLALWNLGDEPPSLSQKFRALMPAPWWGPRDVRDEIDPDRIGFPDPYLTARDRKGGAWGRVRWASTKSVAKRLNVYNPFRFLLHSYVYYRNDEEDRRFYQTYTLLRLYEQVSNAFPSPGNAPPLALIDLKYELLINRHALGVLMDSEAIYSFVEGFESKLRVQMGKVASSLHAEANFYHLGFQEVRYGLPGQPPVLHAAVISIRGSDLPQALPDWPSRNYFDLGYNPYTHPEIRRLAKAYPEEEIPLAFYVLASDLRMKPLLVADFFNRANPGRREATSSLRIGIDHALAITNLPLLYRTLEKVAHYGLDKKDRTHFSARSSASGVESLRLFSRLEWQFDSDTNYMLLSALENRVANPLSDSFRRESQLAKAQYAQLINHDQQYLAAYLRRLYEDDMRNLLALSNRAIFEADFERYQDERIFQEALQVVRHFNRQTHQSGISWKGLFEAGRVLTSRASEPEHHELKAFRARLEEIFPDGIPERYHAEASGLISRPMTTATLFETEAPATH